MTRLEPCDVLVCYDGSLEGFFTVVFQAYAQHIFPAGIEEARYAQPTLCQPVLDVSTDFALAERVKVGICNRAGFDTFKLVQRAFASCEEGRELRLLRLIVAVMEKGRSALVDPSDSVVHEVERLALRVTNELEDIRQFARFRKMENGVYLAVVNPRSNLVPMVMSHFVERFNTQPFVIYDEAHHVAGIYDMRGCYFVKADQLELPQEAAGERSYQSLWKAFYDSLSNEQRYNPDLRRSMMPKRFWRNLTEMTMSVQDQSNLRL